MKVTNRVAVVVGGASGMGRAVTQRLAGAGARVVLVDRDATKGRSVAEDVGAAFYECDILDETSVGDVLEAASARFGGMHVAVNTAGGGIVQRTLRRDGPHDLDAFRRVIELNLVATFNLNRLQAWHMSHNEPDDGERGVIVNTSSIAAFEGQVGQVAYGAAKAGIAGMALTMARDLGSLGIRVAAIAPSLFATDAIAEMPSERAENLVAGAAFPRRLGRPDEFARLAMSIIDNPMLNGTCLRLDAGQRFGPR